MGMKNEVTENETANETSDFQDDSRKKFCDAVMAPTESLVMSPF